MNVTMSIARVEEILAQAWATGHISRRDLLGILQASSLSEETSLSIDRLLNAVNCGKITTVD